MPPPSFRHQSLHPLGPQACAGDPWLSSCDASFSQVLRATPSHVRHACTVQRCHDARFSTSPASASGRCSVGLLAVT